MKNWKQENSEGEKYPPFVSFLSHPNTRPMTEAAPKAAQWETEEPCLVWQDVALEHHENCLLKLHTALLVKSKCCQSSLDQYSASSKSQCSLRRGVVWGEIPDSAWRGFLGDRACAGPQSSASVSTGLLRQHDAMVTCCRAWSSEGWKRVWWEDKAGLHRLCTVSFL